MEVVYKIWYVQQSYVDTNNIPDTQVVGEAREWIRHSLSLIVVERLLELAQNKMAAPHRCSLKEKLMVRLTAEKILIKMLVLLST